MKRLKQWIKNLFEAATDGSKGSIVDVIKLIIKAIAEFVKAIRYRASSTLQKLADREDISTIRNVEEEGDK